MALSVVPPDALQHCPPENSLCGECEEALAVVDCDDCHESYCKACCDVVHGKGRRKQHKRFFPIMICGQCEAEAAKMECEDCGEYYCVSCCSDIHSRGQRVKHKNIRPILPGQFRQVNGDEGNAFALLPRQMVFSRFVSPCSVYRMRLSQQSSLCADFATLCRDDEKPYVDSEPASLSVPPLRPPQQIATVIQTSESLKELEAELSLHEEARLKRMAVIGDVLSNVYSWRRPRQFTEFPSLFTSGNTLLAARPACCGPAPFGYVAYLPCFRNDGIFMDYFFLLALSALASRRHLLVNLFVSCEHADVGMYTMQFHKDACMGVPGWYPVTIDNLVPCGRARTPAFGATDDANEMWPVLLEKAYAKFLGSYALLHYGDAARTLHHMTGGKVDVMMWNAGTLSHQAKLKLWWHLIHADRLGMLVICMARPKGRETVDSVYYPAGEGAARWNDPADDTIEECKVSLNWESGHIVDLAMETTVAGGDRKPMVARMCKLRAFDGNDTTWTGPYSNASRAWTKELRQACSFKEIDDHVFWMDLESFASQYDTLAVLTTYAPVTDLTQRTPPPSSTHFRHAPADAAGETYNTLHCHAQQFSIAVVDPSRGEGAPAAPTDGMPAAAVSNNAVTEENGFSNYPGNDLYATPNWRDDADDESPSPARGEPAGGGFALRIAVGLPEGTEHKPGLGDAPYRLLVFRSCARELQRPMFPDQCDGDDAKGLMEEFNHGIYTPSLYWQFPKHNAVDIDDNQVHPPTAPRNTWTWELPVGPGYYTVAVVKADVSVDLEYILAVTPLDDEVHPLGYEVDVRALGTLVHPECPPAPEADTEAWRMSPRLLVEAEQKRQALVV